MGFPKRKGPNTPKRKRENKFKKFFNKIGNGIKDSVKFVEHQIGTVYNDVKALGNKVIDKSFGLANKTIDKGSEIVLHGEDTIKGTVTGTAQALAFPLVVGGGILAAGLGAYYLTKPSNNKRVDNP